MRRLLALPLFALSAGCPSAGYNVSLTVTVPPDVQAQVSPSNPGLVMGIRLAVAEICQPSDLPFSVPFTISIPYDKCAHRLGDGYENMFVVRLSAEDVASLSDNQPSALCGQSRVIDDQRIRDAISQRAIAGNWSPQGNQTIASGTGGACDDAGDYTGTVSLTLTK